MPADWVLEPGAAQLRDRQASDFDARYADVMVFTACRVWLGVIRTAAARRTEASESALLEQDVRGLLAAVLREIAQA